MRYFKANSLYILVILISVCACSDMSSIDKGKDEVSISNQTEQVILVDVWELNSSNKIEPTSSIAIEDISLTKINSNSTDIFNLKDVKGEFSHEMDIRLFIYTKKDDKAVYQNSIKISWNELKDEKFRILLDTNKHSFYANNFNRNLFSFVDKENKKEEKYSKAHKSKSLVDKIEVAKLTSHSYSLFDKKQNFNLNVSTSKSFEIRTKKLTQNENGTTSLIGEFINGHGHVVLVLSEKGLSGTIRTIEQMYRIEPASDGFSLISLIDESKFPVDHTSEIPLGSQADSLSKTPFKNTSSSSQDVSIQSDYYEPNGGPAHGILVLYTQAVDNNTSDISGLIQRAIDETNQIYGNSNVTQNVYLAHSTQTNYDESGRSYKDHGDALEDYNDGIMDNVGTLRNDYTADIIVLLVDDQEACGRANVVGASEGNAFAVVNYDCATGYYSFAHEIGHLFGARHDRAVDNTDTPYEYGHGYVDPNNNWRTVMAYSDACNGCTRVPYWSNPDVNYPPTGQAMGTSAHEDNARAVANRKYEFRDFRTLPSPINLSLDNSSYPKGEHPDFSWSSVQEAGYYNVYRCTPYDDNVSEYCYSYMDDPNSNNWTDQSVVIANYNPYSECDGQGEQSAHYKVTAQNITGESVASNSLRICTEDSY